MTQDSESPGFNVNVQLSAAAIEVLLCLFIHGPTYDGDVPSKSGRDELFDLKLIGRCDGYQFLMRDGVRLALANKLDRKKGERRRKDRERLDRLDEIEALVRSVEVDRAVGLGQAAEISTNQATQVGICPGPRCDCGNCTNTMWHVVREDYPLDAHPLNIPGVVFGKPK